MAKDTISQQGRDMVVKIRQEKQGMKAAHAKDKAVPTGQLQYGVNHVGCGR